MAYDWSIYIDHCLGSRGVLGISQEYDGQDGFISL
jgi:hypothetical protein